MPEAIIDPPAVESGGINQFTQELAAAVKAETTPKTEAIAPVKTEPKEPVTEPKTEPKTEPTTPKEGDRTAPKEKPMSDWTTKDFDDAMKKAPSKAWKVYEFYKTKSESKIAEAEKKIADIQSKPVETAADAKKIEAYEKQIKELSDQSSKHLKTIAELDYSRSPEFKRQFTDKLASTYETAVKDFAQLSIQDGDNVRPATQQDFDMLRSLPLKEQIARARAMLGDGAEVFFAHRNEIQRIQREGREALARAQEDAESNRTKSELQSKEEQNSYEAALDAEQRGLGEQIPELFGDTDNQEVADVVQKAKDFARKSLSERSKMSAHDRAAFDAAMVMSYAGLRRLVIEQKASAAEIASLKTALAKYQKSDPGTDTTGKAPPTASADDVGGIEQMAQAFKKVA